MVANEVVSETSEATANKIGVNEATIHDKCSQGQIGRHKPIKVASNSAPEFAE